MNRFVSAFIFVLLTVGSQADTFPVLEFETVRGKTIKLGVVSKNPSVIVLSKPGRSNRGVNQAWLEALLDKFGQRSDLNVYMISDFGGIPGFLDKGMLKRKMLETSQGKDLEVLEHMLFDWRGEARPKLVKDSQIYVFVLDRKAQVKGKVVGFYKPERLNEVVSMLKKI